MLMVAKINVRLNVRLKARSLRLLGSEHVLADQARRLSHARLWLTPGLK